MVNRSKLYIIEAFCQEAKLKDLREFMANEQAKRESLGYIMYFLSLIVRKGRQVARDGEQQQKMPQLKVTDESMNCFKMKSHYLDYGKAVLEGKVRTVGSAKTNKENLSNTTPNPGNHLILLYHIG